MNKYVRDMINEAIEKVNGWHNAGASFGAGVAIGILIKHLDEYEKHCIEQGFDEGLECAENLIMYGNYDFVIKMFPEEDRAFDVYELIAKYELIKVNEKYLEFKVEKE